MKTTGQHVDFTKVVLVQMDGWKKHPIPVIDAQAQFCDMCTDPGTIDDPINQAAEYTIISSIEEPEHFCQDHMCELVRDNPDAWKVIE